MHKAEPSICLTEHSVCLCCCTIYDTEGCQCDDEVSCTQNVVLQFIFGPCFNCEGVLGSDQAIPGCTLLLAWAACGFVISGEGLDSDAVEAAIKMSTECYYASSARFNFELEVKRILRAFQPSRIDFLHFRWKNITGKYDDDAWITSFVNDIIMIARKKFDLSLLIDEVAD